MWQDPIVTEVHQTRETHAAQFNFDLKAIYKALKEQEERSQYEKASFSPRRISPIKDSKHPPTATHNQGAGSH